MRDQDLRLVAIVLLLLLLCCDSLEADLHHGEDDGSVGSVRVFLLQRVSERSPVLPPSGCCSVFVPVRRKSPPPPPLVVVKGPGRFFFLN